MLNTEMASVTCASLCSTLLFVGVFVFVSAGQKIITAQPGQDATLTCRAPNNNTVMIVEWSRADLGLKYVLLYRHEQFDPGNQHPSFKNRADLQDRQMKDGDVSLILKNVTINDTGTYECRVFQTTNRRKRANMEANLDSDPISIITLRVAPPGPGGGTTEGGGSVGLIVGLSVSALLLAAVVGFVIYRKHKQNQDPYHPPVELHPV
ncbi:programmed cell death 1 ligand 1-like [Archocentrus centrarchus]|uniref:programmed cell death 1 ligand 1-like n=1 Tax=Archocentrus centrarchus TaxID=63155 RepID=UPI0011E9F50F|nr:programmed cell death 1 ligand 1-like [Archocentrus centrarchus]